MGLVMYTFGFEVDWTRGMFFAEERLHVSRGGRRM
jgi:hypothetical protein